MAQSFLQLTLAIVPVVIASLVIRNMQMPWEKEKRPAERAELLRLLARDIKRVKAIMARNIAAVNSGAACPITPLPLSNWHRIKRDVRFIKYTDEKIFKTMIKQFREWERVSH